MTRAVITGRGVLSPIGCDWASFAAAVREGRAAAPEPFPSAAPDPPLWYPISETSLVAQEGKRPEEPLTTLVTAAAGQALAEAGILATNAPHDDVGLVMSTTLGPSGAIESYLEALAARGPRSARPAHFVDTLLSMPASRLGITFGLRGSTAVLGGSSALELAGDWVRSGRERTVLAGSGECVSAKCARYLAVHAERSGAARVALGQGAGFVVVESLERAAERGAHNLGEVLGAGAASEPQRIGVPWSADPEGRAFACAMGSALKEAEIAPEDVGLVALAAVDDASEAGELAAVRDVLGRGPALLRPKRLFGEALSASAALGLLAALAELEGRLDGAVAMVNAFELGGGVTSLVVRGAP
jgi:3-oxoacyl-[acyl-carrier-protein] synthase II